MVAQEIAILYHMTQWLWQKHIKLIHQSLGQHNEDWYPTRAATSGAYDELAVDDNDEAATILATFAANQKV